MICLLCRKARTVAGLTSIHFERGEIRLIVNNVPARICPSCGEAYVDEDVAIQLLREVEEGSKAGVLEGEIEYNVT